MQKSLFAIAAFALACSESHPAELVETSTGEANVSCSLGCGLERFTLSISDVVLEFAGDDPRSLPGVPLNIGKFSCDSPQMARSFVGTAIDDRDPRTVGQWNGDLAFSAAPHSPSNLSDAPFSLAGEVQLPDGRNWSGFFGALWDPGARSCEIVDGVMRIRVKSRFGAAVLTNTPNGDVSTGSVAGFIEGHLDLTDPLTVISSSFTVRTLGAKDPATVTLSPSLATPELGATQTLTATVVDYGTGAPGSSGPAANESVVFAITGATTQTLICTTDATGSCSVSYPNSAAPGTDSVTAFADIDGDGTLGLGEPSASAEVKWGDASPPVVTTPPPVVAEAQGPSGAVVTFEPPLATDDVGVVGGVQCNPPSGSLFQLGSTQVTCEASDAAGNTGSASFEVSVVDTTAPSIAFSGNAGTYTVDQTVAIECTATDLVTASPTLTCSGGSGPAYAFNLGTNEVVATAVDDAGNQSTASSPFVVNVTVAGICRLASRWFGHSGGGTAPCKSLDALSGRLPPAQRARVIDLFIRAVEHESGRKLPADKAAILIRLASAL